MSDQVPHRLRGGPAAAHLLDLTVRQVRKSRLWISSTLDGQRQLGPRMPQSGQPERLPRRASGWSDDAGVWKGLGAWELS